MAAGGKANTTKGDGKLTFAAPPAGMPADHYTYDPGDPTPDPRAYEESEEDEKRTRSTLAQRKEADGHHAKVTEARNDILVYTTDPFNKPLTIAGPVSARLYAASSAKDTDWFMLLSEVKAGGEILPLAQGKVRALPRIDGEAPDATSGQGVRIYDRLVADGTDDRERIEAACRGCERRLPDFLTQSEHRRPQREGDPFCPGSADYIPRRKIPVAPAAARDPGGNANHKVSMSHRPASGFKYPL